MVKTKPKEATPSANHCAEPVRIGEKHQGWLIYGLIMRIKQSPAKSHKGVFGAVLWVGYRGNFPALTGTTLSGVQRVYDMDNFISFNEYRRLLKQDLP